MSTITTFDKTMWSVVKDDQLLSYNIDKNEGHEDGIMRFVREHNLDLEEGTSFEMSLELAARDYICFHSATNTYLITFMPSVLTNQNQLDMLNKLMPCLQSFKNMQSIVFVNPDGSYTGIDGFNWDTFKPVIDIKNNRVLQKIPNM